ncbi:MAG TPA: RNase adapter RapZ [Ruminococcaceae bacterium]|nr:RNase adapter RapZ [Oscillospiraceae bacterium]
MEFIVVTGLSGAGKSQAINVLEDMGVYCVDNIPSSLLMNFYEACTTEKFATEKVAVVIDSRSRSDFEDLIRNLKVIKTKGVACKILFLDCSADVLTRRYKETRRRHPLLSDTNASTERAIEAEIRLLAPLREAADYLIDTSLLTSSQLKEKVRLLFETEHRDEMLITCLSFGFKFGIPRDADIVMDVRCLPNPFYDPQLKHCTGLDQSVRDFVMNHEQSRELLERFSSMIDFLIPHYKREGKSQLVIAFGCTGGKHRSVTFAELLNQRLLSQGRNTNVFHRDITR